MTTVIDERVVEMRFNNADFEKNVAQSMNTLDKLKNALKFEGGAKSLEELGKAAGNFKLSGITETISEATSKFSVMEIAGVTAIAKITSSIMDMGTKLVKSLSVDQVTAGFSKYEDKTTAIQTIMAATAKDYTNQKEQLEDINNQMSKLMWFTDETSYNFVDMVGNIGKFTSQKVPLNDAVTAMQGIANWAAKSGQNAQAASRAMYNISQAMGAGSMKTKDWMSIENANMATYEFKETAAETAVQLGRLRKIADGLYETLDGKQFTIEQFREQLKSGWFDKEVMSQTFAVYGRFTDTLYNLSEATGKTATELLQDVESYSKGTLDLQAYSEETKVSVEDLTAAFDELNAETNEVGKTAFKNAQEAKTFGEVIDSVKDAVSTKWTETFEIIFGNYLEAKKLWTGLANDLWEVFAGGIDDRNEVLGIWKELGGRNSLIRGVIEWANLLVKPLSAIRQAFFSLLPDADGMGQALKDITDRFKELGERLQPSQEMLDNIFRTFRGLFSLAGMIGKVFTAIIKAVIPAARPFGTLFEMILRFTGYVGVVITAVAEYADEVGLFESITAGLIFAFEKLFGAIKTVLSVIGGALLIVATTVGSVFGNVITKIAEFLGKTQLIAKTIDTITRAVNFFKNTFSSAEKPIEKVNTVIKKSEEYFGAAAKSGAEYGTITKEIGDESKKALTPLEKFGNFLKKIVAVLGLAATTVAKVIVNLWTRIREFFDGIKQRLNDTEEDKNVFVIIFEEIFGKLKEILGDAKDALKEFFDNLGIDTTGIKEAFSTITGALGTFLDKMDGGKIAAIALSIALLALVGKAIDLSSKIGALTSAMSGFFTNINKILKKQFLSKQNFLTDLAKAFTMVAASLALLIYVDKDNKLPKVAAIMGGLVASLAVLSVILEAVSNKLAESKVFEVGFNALTKNILMLAASVVVLSAALAIMAQIKFDSWGQLAQNLIAAIGLLAGLVGAAIVLAKFAPVLSAGGFLLLAIALAMKALVSAFNELASLTLSEISDTTWAGFIALFTGVAEVIAASSLIRLSSAVGLFILAKSLQIIIPEVGKLVKIVKDLPVKDWIDTALKNFDGMLFFMIGALSLLMTVGVLVQNGRSTVRKFSAGNILTGIGAAFAGIGVGIALIVSSIVKLHKIMAEFAPGELEAIGKTLGLIIVAMGLFAAFVIAVNAFTSIKFAPSSELQFIRLAGLLVGLALAVRIMSSAVKTLANISSTKEAWLAVGIIVVLGALLTACVGVAGTVPKAIPAISALLGITISLGVLIGELAILSLLVSEFANESDWTSLAGAVGIMTGFFVGLRALMMVMGSLAGVKAGTIMSLAVVIGLLGGVMVALTVLGRGDMMGSVAMAAMSLGGVLLALGFVFTVVGQMDVPSVKKMLSILSIAVTIGAIGTALYFVSQQPWEQILTAGLMIAAVLGVIGGILIVLDKIGSQGGQLGAAGAIGIISLAAIAVATAIRILDGVKWETFGMFAAAMGVLAGILGVLALVTAVFPPFGVALGVVSISLLAAGASFLLASVGFAVFAAALPHLAEGLNALTPALIEFAKVPFSDIGVGLSEMAVGLGAIGLAGIFVGIGSLGLILLAVALRELAEVAPIVAEGLNRLAEVPLTDIAGGLAAIGAAGGVIGLLSPLILLAAAALSVFSVSLLILKAGLDAVSGIFDSFATGFGNMVDFIKEKIEDLKTVFDGLFPDLANGFSGPKAGSVIQAAVDFAKKVAGGKNPDTGFIGGLASALGWHSTPDVEEELMDDIAGGFSENGSVVAAAESSGSEIGNGFGKSFFDSASKWFSNLGASASSWLNNLSASFHGSSIGVQGDLNSTGAAAEKFGKTTEKTTGGIIDKIKDGYHKVVDPISEKVNKQIEDTTNGLFGGADATNYITEQIEDATKAAEEAATGMGNYGDATEGAGKKAGKAAKDVKSLKDTIEGQLDMFSKFEIKTGVTSKQMLENMKSNIDGMASWSHRMTVLAERGIDQGLLQKLAELGPKGYETMNAFYEMTEEELKEANELWATGLTLPESQSAIVASAFQYAGEMATQGFSHALDDHKAAHAAAHGLGQAAIDGLEEALDVHSPSRKTYDIGMNTDLGLEQGIDRYASLPKTSADFMAFGVLDVIRNELKRSKFVEIAENIVLGIIEGLKSNHDELQEASLKVAEVVNETIRKKEEISSPSKVMKRFGGFIAEGLAIGIKDGASNVANAAQYVIDDVNSTFDNMGRIQDYINTFLDFNPVITPLLDLTALESQMNSVNGLFEDQRIGATFNSQNGGNSDTPQTIQFTQNNYSPKALSRIDIYRQTKNEVSMMKGALAHA